MSCTLRSLRCGRHGAYARHPVRGRYIKSCCVPKTCHRQVSGRERFQTGPPVACLPPGHELHELKVLSTVSAQQAADWRLQKDGISGRELKGGSLQHHWRFCAASETGLMAARELPSALRPMVVLPGPAYITAGHSADIALVAASNYRWAMTMRVARCCPSWAASPKLGGHPATEASLQIRQTRHD